MASWFAHYHAGPPSNATADGGAADPTSISTTAVAADVATLVADGASPTQAHVATLNTDWTALLAQITATKAQQANDVVVIVNLATVASVSALNKAFQEIITAARGNSAFTG